MMRFNLSLEYSKKILGGKIRILTDLHTDVTYLSFTSFLSSSLTPMVNVDGSFVTNHHHDRFWFELLDDGRHKNMPVLGFPDRNENVAYYLEWGTGVIYLLHQNFLSTSICPLAKSDGTYFSYSEWKEMHSLSSEPISPKLREHLNQIAM